MMTMTISEILPRGSGGCVDRVWVLNLLPSNRSQTGHPIIAWRGVGHRVDPGP